MKILVFLKDNQWELIRNVNEYSVVTRPAYVSSSTFSYKTLVNDITIKGTTKNKKYTLEYEGVLKFNILPDDAELIKDQNKPIGYECKTITYFEEKA